MSLIRFTRCSQLLSDRRNVRPLHLYLKTVSQTSTKQPLLQKSFSKNTGGLSKHSYSTSLKPHMTPAMHKWKQKKRKSKTQQKMEMEKLHDELVKLLTKRAIALVKNKSVNEAQRGVVTTHVFTSFLHVDGSERLFSATESVDALGLHSFDFRNQSDYVAETLEAHLQKQSQTDSRSRDVARDRMKPKVSVLEQMENNSLNVVTRTQSVPEADTTGRDKPVSVPLHRVSTQENHEYFQLSLNDVFLPVVKSPSRHISVDFQSNLQRFRSELEATIAKYTSSTTPLVHDVWDEDVKETEASNVIDSEPNLTKSSLPSQKLIKSSHRNLKDDMESFGADHLGPSIPYPTWDPYDRTLVDDPDEGVDFHIQTPHNNHLLPDFSESIGTSHNVNSAIVSNQYVLDSALEANNSVSSANIFNKVEQQTKKHSKSSRKLAVNDLQKLKVAKSVDKKSSQKTSSVKTERDGKQKLEHMNVYRELHELTEKSFVDASCFTNTEMVAVRNLQYQASRHRHSSVEVLNRLIHSLAKKEDMKTIKSLFMLIRQQDLRPSLQTYAGCLECVGRMSDPDLQTCEKLLKDISNKGLDLKDIANTCSFESDEWDHVLKAIRLIDVDFVPNPPRLVTEYDNPLLAALNKPHEQALERNQYALDMSAEELYSRAKAQLDMEKQGDVTVKSICAASIQGSRDPKLRDLRSRLLHEWRHALQKSFQRKLDSYKKTAQDNVSMTLYPYLKLFPPEEYINIIIKFLTEMMSSSDSYSPTQAMVQGILGRAVNRKYNTDSKIAAGMGEKVLKLHELYMNKYLSKDYQLDNHRLMWLRAMNQSCDTINMDMSLRRWPAHVQRQIGKFLLELILYNLKVNANLFRPKTFQRTVPAFCSIFRPDVTLVRNAEIKMHPVVTKLFNFDNTESFTFDPSIIPMIVPPVPWISKNMGGLLLGSHALVRVGSDMCHVDVLKTKKEHKYPAVLDSLNTLSSCAWKINQPILDLQIEIFNNKGDARLKVAPPASVLPPMPVITGEMTSQEKAALYRERLQQQQQRQDMHGLWCTDLYRLSIANKFRDEVFWFPHSMDFRGRTYPLPPHFNHLGSDNVRGVLLFAKGKRLGKDGYDWLKIHLVNLTGFKKRCSNMERLTYAQSIMSDILDSADRPLTGNKWWQMSDEPWQTLACCKEIANIERFQGDKGDYVCHFPVHQDGSCNGLQHYAALGRDQVGAESVNLHPFDVPKDVYSDVVDLVEKTRQRHAEEGNETAQALAGFIKRKVIKQTIMTTVYGVTKYGAKLQIHRQLKDIPEIPADLAWKASLYLTETTFACLREMFTATKDIQDWLTESARRISMVLPVEWVTPLGFPVLQPYFKRQNHTEGRFDKFKPNVMKQKNAFPPNYIHSLDSTHMMLTSLYSMHAGVTFVSVHDCYWTHACDVHIMNKICREQFISMHKQALLENLSEHLMSVVKTASQDPNLVADMKRVTVQPLFDLLSNVPKRGSFDLDNVLQSTYFFS